MPTPLLEIRRVDDDTGTVIGYLCEDGQYAAVKIAEQLRALADRIPRGPVDFGNSFNPGRRGR